MKEKEREREKQNLFLQKIILLKFEEIIRFLKLKERTKLNVKLFIFHHWTLIEKKCAVCKPTNIQNRSFL